MTRKTQMKKKMQDELVASKILNSNSVNNNSVNLDFMKKNLEMKKNNWAVWERYKLDLNIARTKQVTFGTNSLKSDGPKILNALPFNMKTVENLSVFKTLIKKQNDTSCNCMICCQ